MPHHLHISALSYACSDWRRGWFLLLSPHFFCCRRSCFIASALLKSITNNLDRDNWDWLQTFVCVSYILCIWHPLNCVISCDVCVSKYYNKSISVCLSRQLCLRLVLNHPAMFVLFFSAPSPTTNSSGGEVTSFHQWYHNNSSFSFFFFVPLFSRVEPLCNTQSQRF